MARMAWVHRLNTRETAKSKVYYTPLLGRALQAIHCANVGSGILLPQFRLRGNDADIFWGVLASVRRMMTST